MDFKEESLLKKSNKWSAIAAMATLIVSFATIIIGYFSYQVAERSVQIAEEAKNLVEMGRIQDLYDQVNKEKLSERGLVGRNIISSFYSTFIGDLDFSLNLLKDVSNINFSDADYIAKGRLRYDYSNFEKDVIQNFLKLYRTDNNFNKNYFKSTMDAIGYYITVGQYLIDVGKETKCSEEVIGRMLKDFFTYPAYSIMLKICSDSDGNADYEDFKIIRSYLDKYYLNDLKNERRRNEFWRAGKVSILDNGLYKDLQKNGKDKVIPTFKYMIELRKYWEVRSNKEISEKRKNKLM